MLSCCCVGLRVVAVARRRDRLEELQQHMLSPAVGAAPVDFLPVVCDITKEPEVAALPRWVVFEIDHCTALAPGSARRMTSSSCHLPPGVRHTAQRDMDLCLSYYNR